MDNNQAFIFTLCCDIFSICCMSASIPATCESALATMHTPWTNSLACQHGTAQITQWHAIVNKRCSHCRSNRYLSYSEDLRRRQRKSYNAFHLPACVQARVAILINQFLHLMRPLHDRCVVRRDRSLGNFYMEKQKPKAENAPIPLRKCQINASNPRSKKSMVRNP